MNDYVIFTDSACDVPPAVLREWNVGYVQLTFRFDGDSKEYLNYEMPAEEFYNRMREGGVAKTSAVNSQTFEDEFREIASLGKDILYLGFSSGLSTTCNSARIALENLASEYPGRKLMYVDTLSASLGFGLLLRLVCAFRDNGASIDEAYEYAKGLVPRLCHWFTVDDLVYLKRGGRISGASAFIGNMLGIKPVLHMDNEGHLINMLKVRGRRASIMALFDKYTATAENPDGGIVFISHGDCESDARVLADLIESRYGAKVELVSNVGAVIGAHSGPGTLALFFLGHER